MNELIQEQFDHEATKFKTDPRHTRYIASDSNNAILIEAWDKAGLEWNAENLHQVFTENLNRLELTPEFQTPIREADINYNVLRARQAAEEARKANDDLLTVQEKQRQEAAKHDEGDTVPFGYDGGRWTSLASQQAARRQQSAPTQFRNGRAVASTELPTSQSRQTFIEAGEQRATELRKAATQSRRHL